MGCVDVGDGERGACVARTWAGMSNGANVVAGAARARAARLGAARARRVFAVGDDGDVLLGGMFDDDDDDDGDLIAEATAMALELADDVAEGEYSIDDDELARVGEDVEGE